MAYGAACGGAVVSGPPPVFVVGAPRSGTTLLSAMLGAHPAMSCGTETDFFHFLAQVDVGVLLAAGRWPEAAVDFLFSMVQAAQKRPVPENYGLSRSEVTAYLSRRRPSVAAILEAVTVPTMAAKGAHRWVEKTPRHILHLKVIRAAFPDAPIVRILRDPRDVALSTMKTPWQWAARDLPGALLMWRYCNEEGEPFFAADPNTHTLHYETLLREPEATLAEVCRFLGEPYSEAMLDTAASYSAVNSIGERWKEKVGGPLDPSRAGVWERELSPEQQRTADCLVGDLIRRFGYGPADGLRYAGVTPKPLALLKYPEALDWLVAEGLRVWRDRNEEAAAAIFLGEPDCDGWVIGSRWQRLAGVVRLRGRLHRLARRGAAVRWFATGGQQSAAGTVNRLLAGTMRGCGTVATVAPPVAGYKAWRHNLCHNPRLGQFNGRDGAAAVPPAVVAR